MTLSLTLFFPVAGWRLDGAFAQDTEDEDTQIFCHCLGFWGICPNSRGERILALKPMSVVGDRRPR